jgi:peptidoglycan hydrolase CwlO-like protein
MKSVGATSWFIRWPFMLEGMILGAVAGVLSLFAVWGIYAATTRSLADILADIGMTDPLPFGRYAAGLLLGFLFVGIVAGTFGSACPLPNTLKNRSVCALKTRIKRLVCVLLCLTLLFTVGAMPRAQATELDDLRKQSELLEKKIAELQKQLKTNSENKKDQEAALRTLNAQLAALDEQIRILKSRVNLLNGEISTLDKDINAFNTEIAQLEARIDAAQKEKTQKQQQIAETTALMLDRMRAAYLAGSSSELDILLSSADLSAFLTRSELLRRVAEKDKLLIATLEKDSADLAALEAELEAARTGVETKKAAVDAARQSVAAKKRDADASLSELDRKQNQIESKSSSAKSILATLDRNSKAWKDQIAKYEREQEQAERAIEEYLRKYGSNTGDTTPPENEGAMTWPLPYSNTYISSNYGYRSDPFSGQRRFHKGLTLRCPRSGQAHCCRARR